MAGGWRVRRGSRAVISEALVCHHLHRDTRLPHGYPSGAEGSAPGCWLAIFCLPVLFFSFQISYMCLDIYIYRHKRLYTRQCYSSCVLVLLVVPVSTISAVLPSLPCCLPFPQLFPPRSSLRSQSRGRVTVLPSAWIPTDSWNPGKRAGEGYRQGVLQASENVFRWPELLAVGVEAAWNISC